MSNIRLDSLLAKRGLAESRERAKAVIMSGNVFIGGSRAEKPGMQVSESIDIEIREKMEYVSRGGQKLEKALAFFGVSPEGRICIDCGASTGGFTDCLLSRGAAKVYAVDSGTDQLSEKLRYNTRVISLEGVNARALDLTLLGERCDIAVMDVSFISQTKLYGALISALKPGGKFVSLVKPQFEAGRKNIGKGGIVRDEAARLEALETVITEAGKFGLRCLGTMVSPITGGDGNVEYLAYFYLE